MGAIPEQSFTVREAAWHGQGFVLADYPGRDEAMRLAGHDFRIVERPVEVVGFKKNHPLDGWKALVRTGTTADQATLHVAQTTYTVIDNYVMYDFLEALIDQGFLYETGGTMGGGAICYVTLLLNEPVQITGDDSVTLPYVVGAWSHNGTMSASARSTSVRAVCENTVSAGEAEASRLGTNFVFRHTKNAMERINEAREVIQGVRAQHDIYVEAMEELARIPVTPEQRDLFVSTIIGDRDGLVSRSPVASDRVKNNVENERAKINATFFGPTIPEAHKLTAYGLHLAGVEYADHLRSYRSRDSYVKRTLLQDSPFKASLRRTIREIVAA